MSVDDDFAEWLISDKCLVIRSIIGGFPKAQASVLRQALFAAFCAGGTVVTERHNKEMEDRIEHLKAAKEFLP